MGAFLFQNNSSTSFQVNTNKYNGVENYYFWLGEAGMGSKNLVLNIFALQNFPKTLKLSSLSHILHVKVSFIILKLNDQFHNLHKKLRDLVLNFMASLSLVLVIRFRYLVDLNLLLTNSSRVHSFQQVLVYYIQGKAFGVTYNCHLDSVQDISCKFWAKIFENLTFSPVSQAVPTLRQVFYKEFKTKLDSIKASSHQRSLFVMEVVVNFVKSSLIALFD